MKRFLLFATTLAWIVLGGGAARAGLAAWTYNWEPGAPAVFADSPGTGKITMTDEPLGHAVGNSDIVTTNLKVFSTADPHHPETFTHKAYKLTLVLTDLASGKSGTLVFTGEFNGPISAKSSFIRNTYTGPLTGSLVLGHNKYTITMGKYSPPAPPGATNFGSISANVVVTTSDVRGTPEPSTLALAGLGLPLVGGVTWWRRRWGRATALGLA